MSDVLKAGTRLRRVQIQLQVGESLIDLIYFVVSLANSLFVISRMYFANNYLIWVYCLAISVAKADLPFYLIKRDS